MERGLGGGELDIGDGGGKGGDVSAPSKGRGAGRNWSISHRMMASGNSSLLNSKSSRSSKR